jgi:hypothetical protein
VVEMVEPEVLPEPSAAIILIRVFVASYLSTAHEKPERRARAFLEKASDLLENEDSVALLRRIRPTSQDAAVSRARQEACAIFREYRPFLLAMLPPR